ncbi:putative transmembrane protein [Lysobacter dokdonensis DS-58]|uniref:Putative transmembrane protein n=1 Tax=Lysobacter dokdonensis DS-58 TaxID=1300345 RepID=A0A0A2WLF1_9GAMM|nr:DUF3106 domain-containing protein [Lysobacter dokdonensis]KGQ19547.1 putative transmembrane protein [Lysobacter dokdonensis DS-58]
MNRRPAWLALTLALLALPVFAQQHPAPVGPPPPKWEQLTPAERDVLIAPIRDRWNDADEGQRRRMLDHARRWTTMTPAQREAAHKGMRRWDHLSPEQRDQARDLFERMRSMPPDQRRELKEKWRAMTPEQRKAWLEQHPPKD